MSANEMAIGVAPTERGRRRLRAWRRLWLPVALALLVFLAFLGKRDIIASHEARVAQVARQMAAVGWPWQGGTVSVPDVGITYVEGNAMRLGPLLDRPPLEVNPWLVPVLNGQIRLQKPPLPYWCVAGLFRLLGFGEGVARLPSALMGAVSTLLIYDVARRLLGRRGAIVAALVWVSSHFVIAEYRKAMADPYVAFFTLACVWAWVRGAATGASVAAAGKRPRTVAGALVLLFYGSLALGVLAKGPVIALHLAIALSAYCFLWRRWLPPGRWWWHLLGVMLFLGIALPWPAYVLSHLPHAGDLWRYESIGELSENTENAREWWFYLPQLLLLGVPWTAVLLVSWVLPWMRRGGGRRGSGRRRWRRRQWFPLMWYGATVVFFSFVNLKKNAYLLPAMPAQTLLIAQGLLWVFAQARRHRRLPRPDPLMVFQSLAGVGLGLALLVLLLTKRWLSLPTVAVALLALCAVWRPLLSGVCGDPRRWLGAQALAYALLITVLLSGYTAEKDNRQSPKPAVARMQAVLREPGTTVLLSLFPEEATLYLPLDMRYDARAGRVLVLMKDRRDRFRAELEPVRTWVGDGRVTAVRILPPPQEDELSRVWKVIELTVDRASSPGSP